MAITSWHEANMYAAENGDWQDDLEEGETKQRCLSCGKTFIGVWHESECIECDPPFTAEEEAWAECQPDQPPAAC